VFSYYIIFKEAVRKNLEPFKIINQAITYLFTIHFPKSMHIVYLVFHLSILKLVMSNTFYSWFELLLLPVIIDGKTEYEIFWIINSKIDCRWVYKLLYKVIWLEYKITKEEFNWLSISKLIYASNLIANFYQAYLDKPDPLLLSQY